MVEAAGDASLSGLDFKAHLMRSYPEKSLASNVLGFVTLENRGYFGVEEKYNDLLSGVPVTVWVPEDPNRAGELPKVPKGADLILTIDREIQAMVEKELQTGMQETGSAAGTIIVMDPRTGGIMAMASTPEMDLNNFSEYTTIYQNASEFNRSRPDFNSIVAVCLPPSRVCENVPQPSVVVNAARKFSGVNRGAKLRWPCGP